MLTVWHNFVTAMQPRVTMPRARETDAHALLAGDVEAGVGRDTERCGDLEVCVDT